MSLSDMNPGNMAGTLVLLMLFGALYPAFKLGVNHILANSSGIVSEMANLIIPLILLAILANFWVMSEEDGFSE